MPVEERRALARDLDHLKRYPDDPRNAAIRKQVESLDKKKRAALSSNQVEKAKEALAKGDPDQAVFFPDMAALIEPGHSCRAAHGLGRNAGERAARADVLRARGDPE